MYAVRSSLPFLALLLVAPACSEQAAGRELGAQCLDGKDNDDDGRIDCSDNDCSPLGVCGGVRPDSSGPTLDLGPPADQGPPPADQGPVLPPDQGTPVSSSFGQRCTFSGKLSNCADGETTCVPSPRNNFGYCTHPCTDGQVNSCPATSGGQRAACLYGFNQVHYCLFVCELFNETYPCPTGFTCVSVGPGQRVCVL